MSEEQLAHLSDKSVTYILLNRYPDGQIDKSSLIKECLLQKDVPFNKVFPEVQRILKTRYGLELVKCTPLGTKFRIVSLLPYVAGISNEPDPNDLYRDTVLFMILCNILLDRGSSTFESIQKMLNGINFDLTQLDTQHDLQEFIKKSFVQKNYLLYDEKNDSYQWSPMSTELYDKTECLKVACDIINVPLSTYMEEENENNK